jgi:hypothetical protein
MPRVSQDSDSLVADLRNALQRLVDAARSEGREEALAEMRDLVAGRGAGGGGGAPVAKRGPGRPKGSKNKAKAPATTKSGKKRKNSWAGLSPEQKLARVNAIRKGRGLPPKTA